MPKISMPTKRYPPPEIRSALTKKANVGSFTMYITVGFYHNSQPCEVFITTAKQGSTVAGFMDSIAIGISYGLQYGIPWSVFAKKYSHMTFEPKDDDSSSAAHLLASVVSELVSNFGGNPDKGPMLDKPEEEEKKPK